VSEIRFADTLDGWAYGPALYATHDGAANWARVNVGGSVVALETAGGYVDAVVSSCPPPTECHGTLRLEQARATGGPFTTLLSGPAGQVGSVDAPELTLQPPAGFVILGHGASPDIAWLDATADLSNPHGWNRFPDPCAGTGFALTSMVAPTSTVLSSLCSGNGAMGSSTKLAVVTENGHARVTGRAPLPGAGGTLAATSTGTLVIASASGASWLYRSTDGGHTWATALDYPDGGIGFNDLGFTTDTQGIVIHGRPRAHHPAPISSS
jgi:hypothetical protein